MKEVLVAAYYFPPYADVSGVRVSKFCKYLPEQGWHPIVLTVDPRFYRGKVVERVPNEVHAMELRRIPYLPIPGATLLVKLFFPLLIFGSAWRLRRRVSAVYLAGSPFHPFFITALITPLLGLSTLLDFRDSWSTNPMFSRYPWGWQRWLVKLPRTLIERIGIAHASAVSFVTTRLMDEFARRLPHRQGKFHTIDNGFDPADFDGLEPERVRPGPTLILTGKFGYYTPEVVSGLMMALHDVPRLHFVYVGGEAEVIEAAAAQAGVADRVGALPFQPRDRMLRLIKGADYGLMTASERYAVGTKIFDYLALGKPVLCFVPRGSAVGVTFADTPGVIVCEGPHVPMSISAGLRMLLDGECGVHPEAVQRFSRRDATRTLAQLLDGISGAADARRVPASR